MPTSRLLMFQWTRRPNENLTSALPVKIRKFSAYVNKSIEVSSSQIVKHRRFIQVGQIRHVLCQLELRWIHLLQVILLDNFVLQYNG